jgi:hypothetical protein
MPPNTILVVRDIAIILTRTYGHLTGSTLPPSQVQRNTNNRAESFTSNTVTITTWVTTSNTFDKHMVVSTAMEEKKTTKTEVVVKQARNRPRRNLKSGSNHVLTA